MCHHPSVVSLVIAVAISGCGSPIRPTSPSVLQTAVAPPATVPQPAPQPTYTLSGVVSELTSAGTMPAAGVQLYCDSCGSPDGHTFTTSDPNGFYSFSWTRNGVHPLLVWKDGYAVIDPSGTRSNGVAVTVDGDTRFDIQIVRR
jgi:hypothetical protein